MNPIEFNHVWKKFRKGERFNSLRDAIPNLFRAALNKNIGLKNEEFWALQDVSFQIKRGEIFGIIGDNGAGKSTCLKLLAGIMKSSKGETLVMGRLSALIEITAGFHPDLTGRENVYLNGTILGMTKKEIDNKFNEIVDFSGIGEFIDTPVKRYSSGMYSRLGFSVAAHMDADILLVDEVLSVGDTAFQAKCAQKMRELLNSGKATIVLVSHNLPLIKSLCKRVVLLSRGKILKEGIPEEVIPFYQDIIYKSQEQEFKQKIASAEYKIRLKQDTPINIISVSLYDDTNKQKENFRVGESINIKFDYEAKEIIENPIFYLDIIRSDGVVCCCSSPKDYNVNIERINGIGTINIDLGNINLTPGIYMAKISVWNKDSIHPYALAKKEVFRIQPNDVDYGNAVFVPKIDWKLR
jgi:lipopolysaccharide transport system ATP-binding protein